MTSCQKCLCILKKQLLLLLLPSHPNLKAMSSPVTLLRSFSLLSVSSRLHVAPAVWQQSVQVGATRRMLATEAKEEADKEGAVKGRRQLTDSNDDYDKYPANKLMEQFFEEETKGTKTPIGKDLRFSLFTFHFSSVLLFF